MFMKYSNSYRIMLYILLFAAGQMPNVPPEVPELELDCGGEGKVVRGCLSSGTWPQEYKLFLDPLCLGPQKRHMYIYVFTNGHISPKNIMSGCL